MEKAVFDHPLNVTCGVGRIIYDEYHKAWVLPGGAHTRSKDVAEHVAARIDALTRLYWERRKPKVTEQ
mgnify:CR=1 FL=1